ncbi:hypothetical protein LGH83_08770 [Lichenihabitans sp. PAMC28606]|uniref:hypothetical protein n=1 Tax=Lichenihabitans sp. PAMC28606 TaxID=2880932 RepID=UPI001D0B10A5|nr:hypothetical protein [Lichenihabitans sp. PAMC28606]UDL96253.1 hypothetical protein LGH83_08770 [Lichenihabitans sp. PAMC28606]
MTLPFIFCAMVTAISAIVSLSFSIVALRSISGEARTLALYASARSLALVIVSVAAFAVGATAWLEAVAWCMIIVQACDAAVGITISDRLRTFGPAATALLNLAALIWLLA